ncbi:hypothetical protein ACE1CD_01480 [Aerosakkonema sp. BLCC-F183]|uniref:hypothetical protein n=1 Tax=Aerosakkonema sp. BLCC-F183 TaxID=3342834 RepID=UPI0035B917EA
MLTKKSKNLPQIEGFFSPRSPLEFLGYTIVSGMIPLIWAGQPIGFIFVSLFALVWWQIDRWRTRKQAQRTAFSVNKESPRPAKGLILLLSPYNPMNPSLKDEKLLKQLLDTLLNSPQPQAADFDNISLPSSNLLPQIKAIEYHIQQGSLRDVWLICSESYDTVKGSEITAAILEKYLHFQYGQQRLDIHTKNLSVKDYDYASLCQLGEKIFREAGYKDEVLVADITGGTKMMSVALAMACIPPGRRMQYMDSQRDWQGNPLPKGQMSPVVIDVDPILY